MKIKLIDKSIALQLAAEINNSSQNVDGESNALAFEANGQVNKWQTLMALSDLKDGEYCVFYNDIPAMEVVETDGEPKVLSMQQFHCENISNWEVVDNDLHLTQKDGEVIIYKFRDDLKGWYKDISSTS